jgi:hypothetical protein
MPWKPVPGKNGWDVLVGIWTFNHKRSFLMLAAEEVMGFAVRGCMETGSPRAEGAFVTTLTCRRKI